MPHCLSLPTAAATFSLNPVGNLQQAIEEAITEATGIPFQTAGSDAMGGGCIHAAACISGQDGRRFFVKSNNRQLRRAFEAEMLALSIIAATRTIRVPEPVAVCQAGQQSALVMEFLPMGQRAGDWSKMGTALAEMHRHTAEQHGWEQDNWIGSFPQKNSWRDQWIQFYADCRLVPQFSAAREKGLRLSQSGALLESLPRFFEDYVPQPSLLHGDLWSGNAAFLEDGSPVVFDPASYYGDRETDLAMTEMFGGFNGEFYRAYNAAWPLDAGYRVRKQLYILYHTLNHYNLFGGGYGAQAESQIRGLLSGL